MRIISQKKSRSDPGIPARDTKGDPPRAPAMKKILIIDDNKAVCDMLEKWFRADGYLTAVANDGLQGLAVARQEKPNLIVLDVMLPGMDGFKVCRMIKFDQELKKIPILILTSRMGQEDEKLAYQCGADAFVIKATKMANVMDKARDLIEKGGSVKD
jgi:two-component system, OmpR family, alkaline phosphatase synthesis response regulator PhoP